MVRIEILPQKMTFAALCEPGACPAFRAPLRLRKESYQGINSRTLVA